MDVQISPISLNGFSIATYTICYKIKDGVHVNDCLFVNCKKEVSVRRFCSLNLQRNLIFVDMIFPNILADIALEAFLGKVKTLSDYISIPKSFRIVDELNDTIYFNEKIREFLKLLLFSDIQQEKLSAGTIYSDRIYSVTNNSEFSQIFSVQQSSDLVELMLPKFILKAEKSNACITNNELYIVLEISTI